MFKTLKTLRREAYRTATRFATDERGDFAQFALILALVVVVAIAALQGLGTDITDMFNQVRAAL